MKKTFIIILVCLISVRQTVAYIDPGTGGLLLESIVPFVLSVLAVIGMFFATYFYKPIKRFFKKIFEFVK